LAISFDVTNSIDKTSTKHKHNQKNKNQLNYFF